MKVMNIENPQEFLKVIDSCSGQVELVTADGDRLNLKSKLCQLVIHNLSGILCFMCDDFHLRDGGSRFKNGR